MKFLFTRNRPKPAAAKAALAKRPPSPNYHNPPADHRFRKGQSGNPKGRPPRVTPAREIVTRLPSDSLHDMVLAEANRMVRIQVGDRAVEIPVIQAALREVALSAAKGNRLALAAMTQLVTRLMPEQLAPPGTQAAADPAPPEPAPDTAVAAAEEYKRVWTALLCEAAEVEDAELAAPVPNPDDVAIAHLRGEASWPDSTPGEFLSLDDLAALHERLAAELPPLRERIDHMPVGYDRAVARCDWFGQNDLRRLIARHLPDRYGTRTDAESGDRPASASEMAMRRVALADREYYAPDRVAERERQREEGQERQRQIDADLAAKDAVAAARRPAPVDPKVAAQKAEDAAYRAWVYRKIEEEANQLPADYWFKRRYDE